MEILVTFCAKIQMSYTLTTPQFYNIGAVKPTKGG